MPEQTSQERRIALGGRQIAYTVRRSERARRVGLRIGPVIGLEVVLPARGRSPDVTDLLREKADWILATLDRLTAAVPPAAVALATDAPLPYRGIAHRLIVHVFPLLRSRVVRDADVRTLTVEHDPASAPLAAVLEGWYRQEARTLLTARAAQVAADLGVTYARLTIRDGRSRWGSCSSAGGLNFSWRLILAPPDVLEYLVVHELAHLRELNHSPRFWAIVAEHCPEYRLQQRWLKDHGAMLQAVLR